MTFVRLGRHNVSDQVGTVPPAAKLGPRFVAITADGAQDFASTWWLPLLTLLEDRDGGVFYVFSDDNQAIYRRPPARCCHSTPTGRSLALRLPSSATLQFDQP